MLRGEHSSPDPTGSARRHPSRLVVAVERGTEAVTSASLMGSSAVISRARVHSYRLPLKRPWRSARGNWTERRGWLIQLVTRDGLAGYGDCAPLPEAGTELFSVAETALGELLGGAQGCPSEVLLKSLDGCIDAPATRCGVECALLDILSKRETQPLARWLNATAANEVSLNAALGVLDSDIAHRAHAAIEKGHQVLKVKLGIKPAAREIAELKELVETLPDGIRLRLDANGSWDEATASSMIAALGNMPIESLEEPVTKPTWSNLVRLQALAPWPIAMDESLPRWQQGESPGQLPVSRLVLKPMVLGGVLPAMATAIQARAAGVSSIVTSTVDSAAGVHAAAQLAAALAGDLAHGLATSDWFKEDLGSPPTVEGGKLRLDNTPGIGFTPRPGLCLQ